jgi:hypothetical protein
MDILGGLGDFGGAENVSNYIGELIAAVAALGTAAYGLIDVSKAFNGGVSRIGKNTILVALAPFGPALVAAVGPGWQDIVIWQWINGVAKDDQKAKAKSLIRLGLTTDNARALAGPGHVNADDLANTVDKLLRGGDLLPQDVNVLGRFDASVDAILDSAYEHADQQYRTAARGWAAAVAWALAVIGGVLLFHGNYSIGKFLLTSMIGAVAVPLAPIAKDLTGALTSAIGAIGAATGKKSA